MSRLILRNFRIVDETTDTSGSVIIEDGIIKEVYADTGDGLDFVIAEKELDRAACNADTVLDGGGLLCMPAFIDLHAHFREPGFSEKETLESACLAAAAGGYGTAVCMANTNPVIDNVDLALAIRNRTNAIGLADIYPVMALTKNMEGKELSDFTFLTEGNQPDSVLESIRLLSEDGKDVADDAVFFSAMTKAGHLPISCHCDLDGENNATKRVLELGKKAACRLHIAHVSTKEAIAMIRLEKKALADNPSTQASSFSLSCEVTPHHIALTQEDADALGIDSHGRVNPPLRTEEDRQSLIASIIDGTVDAIATDHAPHTTSDKEKGAPGFTGLETAFAVCYSTLVAQKHISLSKLSCLMSATPARILGLDKGRGRITPGFRADIAIADITARWIAEPAAFMSRGKNSPFAGKELAGIITRTIHGGRIVFDRRLGLKI
jgi:dihydroorotase